MANLSAAHFQMACIPARVLFSQLSQVWHRHK